MYAWVSLLFSIHSIFLSVNLDEPYPHFPIQLRALAAIIHILKQSEIEHVGSYARTNKNNAVAEEQEEKSVIRQ
jgi:hypothetical protein